MKKNLIYIFADQWNKQVMGRYNSQIQTPAMDNFAQESLVFENAISTYPLCSPHRAALLTGKYPYSLGMWTNCKLGLNEKVRLHPNETTIGSVLKKAGYQTAYIGKWHLDASEMNFSAHPASGATHWDAYTPPGDRRHGFDFWYSYGAMDNHMNPHYWQDSPTQIKPKKWSPEAETDVALQYLADLHGRTVASQKLRGGERQSQRVADLHGRTAPSQKSQGTGLQESQEVATESHRVPIQPANETKPFCMFLSWNPPHPPYDQLPEELANRYDGATLAKAQPANVPESLRNDPTYQKNLQYYYGAVHGLDLQFRRILDYLQATGLDKNTYVVLSADHGDMLGAHGLMGKNIWYEESITIPCMIRGPHIEPGVTDALFSSIDHMPTLLELLGVEIPDTVQGQSFAGHCVPVEATTEDESAKARSLKSIGSAESAGTKPSKRTNSAAVKAGEPNPEAVFLSMIPGMPDMVQAYHAKGLHHKCFGWRGIRTKTHTYVVDNGCTPGESQKRWLYNLQSDPLQLKPQSVILGTLTGDAIAKKYDQILIQFLTQIEDPFIMVTTQPVPQGTKPQTHNKEHNIMNNYKTLQGTPITQEEIQQATKQALGIIEASLPEFTHKFKVDNSENNFYIPQENWSWTSGFWTGQLWIAYELTKDPAYCNTAQIQVEDFLRRIEEKYDVDHHDMGFLYSLSCVAAYKLTGNEKGKQAALLAADQLISRYQEKGKFIQAWGKVGAKDNYRLIIDCLLNLPLLYWATEVSGKQHYAKIAQNHINTSLQVIMREDHSTHHTFFFEQGTGKPLHGVTHQGYSNQSAWARGQAWGIYGTALSYRYTKNEEYKETFVKITNYFLDHLPADLVPYWDLIFTDGSEEPRDSSAGAIAVCGILEMCKYLPADQSLFYKDAALKILRGLVQICAVASPKESNGLLKHGVYGKKSPHNECRNHGVDECNTWGDYFYMEALIRLQQDWDLYW